MNRGPQEGPVKSYQLDGKVSTEAAKRRQRRFKVVKDGKLLGSSSSLDVAKRLAATLGAEVKA